MCSRLFLRCTIDQHCSTRALSSGCAAALHGLCITPDEFQARLGEFSHYCPVSLARGELVDCSSDVSLQYSTEFRYVCELEKRSQQPGVSLLISLYAGVCTTRWQGRWSWRHSCATRSSLWPLGPHDLCPLQTCCQHDAPPLR